MNPFQELYSTRATFLAFVVPFVSAGICFAVISVAYQLHDLPPIMVRPIDIIYGIVLAFVDIGTSAGLVSLVILSVIRKLLQITSVKELFQKVLSPRHKNESGHDRISELASDSSST